MAQVVLVLVPLPCSSNTTAPTDRRSGAVVLLEQGSGTSTSTTCANLSCSACSCYSSTQVARSLIPLNSLVPRSNRSRFAHSSSQAPPLFLNNGRKSLLFDLNLIKRSLRSLNQIKKKPLIHQIKNNSSSTFNNSLKWTNT